MEQSSAIAMRRVPGRVVALRPDLTVLQLVSQLWPVHMVFGLAVWQLLRNNAGVFEIRYGTCSQAQAAVARAMHVFQLSYSAAARAMHVTPPPFPLRTGRHS